MFSRAFSAQALLHARSLAIKHSVGLSVIFCLAPAFHGTFGVRQYAFMLKGLQEVEAELHGLGIPFHCAVGDPVRALPAYLEEHDACALVADFSPLKLDVKWRQGVCDALESTPVYEVDTHNVVPVWIASDKQEVGARTIRKKITEKLPTWLTDIPKVERLPAELALSEEAAVKAAVKAEAGPMRHSSASLLAACTTPTDWAAVRSALEVDTSVTELEWCTPGYKAGMAAAEAFAKTRLKIFADKRNDPNAAALSDLSPYFHFGHVSPQRVALIVKALGKSSSEGTAAFLEESIVRRELADNFCFYQPNYDSLDGAAVWARDSLELHADDKREHTYTLAQLESARSHEDIWNAAQRQLVFTGKMHGFMRMYWAKKILEWSPTPAEALAWAVHLNDKYSIDGRDPNGYVGCAWSIMGTHDMGWAERAVFGKIRYMNYNGCKRKFDIGTYVAKWGSGPIKPGSGPGEGAIAKAFGATPGKSGAASGKAGATPGKSGATAGKTQKKPAVAADRAAPVAPPAKKAKLEVCNDPLW